MASIAGLIRNLRQGTTLSRVRQEFAGIERRQNCRNWNVGSVRELDVEIDSGVMMTLYTHNVLSHLIYCKGFEYSERKFLTRFLRPGDVFFDVGANIGLYSLLASAAVGTAGRVYGFEPAGTTFERLQRNCAKHGGGNIECVRKALSDTPGELTLHEAVDGKDAWNTVGSPASIGSHSRPTQVEATTLDIFVANRGLQDGIAMVKVDVEGWELNVLRGAERTLSGPASPVLQIEFTDDAAAGAGSSCGEVYRLVESFGYKFYEYDAERNTLTHSPIRATYPYLNLFAAKDLGAVMQRLAR